MSESRVKIEKLVCEGYGLGHVNGRVIFVPYSAPGDELLVEITSVTKGVQWGRINKILIPSPSRTEPFCPHYGNCGGCQWQHIAYPAQVEYKRQIVEDTLGRLAGIRDISVNACLPSPQQTKYRHRVRLHCQEGAGLGFYQPQSHIIVPVENCPLLTDGINAVLGRLQRYIAEYPLRGLSEVQIMEGTDSGVILSLLFSAPVKSGNWIKSLQEVTGAAGVCLWTSQGKLIPQGRTYAEIAVDGKPLRISSRVFFQANLSLLPAMIQHIRAAIRDKTGGGLELYAGAGVFSLPLAEEVDRLVTAEWNKAAAADALANLSTQAVKNVLVYPVSAEQGLELAARKGFKPELIVADPPREGLSEAVRQGITALSPRQFIYISCNPATLARDLKSILATGRYQLADIQPLDMFPYTSHIETIADIIHKS